MEQTAHYSPTPTPHVDEPVDHATLLLDATQHIKAVSPGIALFFRAATSEILGRPASNFLPALSLLAEGHDRRYPRGERARLKHSREHTIARRGDGTEIPVTVSLFETREEDGVLLWLRHLHTEGEEYCPIPDYCPVPIDKLMRAEES
ncbi:MAG: hypothetical protein PHU46_13660 [Rhodocyclaceae bacterium]|nr:hypothetical protein [Rhodocyclaceae bacterium]